MPLTALRRQPLYPKRMASSLNNTDWIEWVSTLMGGVSRQTQTATLPPDRFYCLLDELPFHLIPRRYLDLLTTSETRPQPLFLNRSCVLPAPGKLPGDLLPSPHLFSLFAIQEIIAWVRDESTFPCLRS